MVMSLNLASIVFESAKCHAEQCALAPNITYNMLASRVSFFAQVLKDKGVRPGDRVALISENRPEFTYAYFAILTVGAVVVPVNVLLATREVTFCLNHAEVGAVIFSASVRETVTASIGHANVQPVTFCVDDLEFENISSCGSSRHFDFYPTSADDTAVIFYTSGTTGNPKGAEVTHFNLYSNAQWVSERSLTNGTARHDFWGAGHCTLAVLALSHSFGQTCMQNAPLLNGGCVSYLPKFNVPELIDKMIQDRVTILAAVPRMIMELLKAPNKDTNSLSHFKYCLVGGAPIDQVVVEQFETQFNVSVLEGYGLSETSPVIAFRTPEIPRKQGSVGRAIRGVDIKVVDDNGQKRAAGEKGEIIVRGQAVMKGYYKNEKATHETIREGWLHTGDVGYLDGDGDVYLVDRKKDVIIRNGYNIYPVEVEAVLCEFPGIVEAAVIGINDAQSGQEIKAFVVGDVDTDALLAYCRGQLAAYKYPRVIEVVGSLPKGTKGQVLRRQLR